MISEKDYDEAKELASNFAGFVSGLNGKLYEEDVYNVNFYKLPYIVIDMEHHTLTKENIDTLNYYISKLKENKVFAKLKRTNSGGVCIEKDRLHSTPFQFDVVSSTSKHIVTLISPNVSFKLFVGFSATKTKEAKKSGRTPSRRLLDAIEESGIDFSKYANEKDEGALAAKMIHKPEVRIVEAEIDKIYYNNIHHLDFHKFYPSGIVLLYPELRPAFAKLRKKQDKEALDIGTRYLASKYAGFKYAKLVKDGINYIYQRFYEVADELKKSGRKVLAFNTDGIWYQGELFNGKYQGEDFGEWSNDYIDVKQIRFATEGLGKYEFITREGVYVPRVKGLSSYEREKNRMNWEWGDIYKGNNLKIIYNYKEEEFVVEGIE